MSKPVKNNSLPQLKGESVVLRQEDFKKLGEFLYYEGSLLSHFVNAKNEDFIMKWVGEKTGFHRWLLFKTNYELLHRFFKGEISDRELVIQNPEEHVYFLDIDQDINWENIIKVKIADLSVDYLPLPDSFYQPGDFEPYGENLRIFLDLHFSRLNKLYKIPDAQLAFAAEPPAPKYRAGSGK